MLTYNRPHSWCIAVVLFSIASFLCKHADAQVLDVGTPGNASNWEVTGAGATASTPFQTNVNRAGGISIADNARSTGTFLTGGTLSEFNGFWFADNSFFIPENATDIRLDFSELWGNDRVVVQLNGVDIGNANFTRTIGVGLMALPPTETDQSYDFTETLSGSIDTGFVLGGQNVLRLIVNNTGLGPVNSPTATFLSDGDATNAKIVASVSFTIVLLGDANLDDAVDFSDIASFISVLQSGTFLEQADCNQDGVVNFADIAPFIAILQGN